MPTGKNKYQRYAELLDIPAHHIDDVWIDAGACLFIDVVDGSFGVEHTGNFTTEHGTTVFDNVEAKCVEFIGVGNEVHDYPIAKDKAQALIEHFFESSVGTKHEYIDRDTWENMVTEPDTMQSLGFTNSDFLYGY